MDNQQRFNIKQVASVLNMEPSAIRHLVKSGTARTPSASRRAT